jgi:hypothetical protein
MSVPIPPYANCWFGSSGDGDGNMMKILDAKIMATTATPTSRKLYAMVVVITFDSANIPISYRK